MLGIFFNFSFEKYEETNFGTNEKVELKYRDRNLKSKINLEIEKMNLEILLLNTITALKVQTVINKSM